MKISKGVALVIAAFAGQAFCNALLAQTPVEKPLVETLEAMEFDTPCNGFIAKLEDVKTPQAKTTAPQIDPKWPLSTPEYPPRSRRMNEEGTVLISFLVTEHGNVASARVSKSSGWPNLDHAAIKETGYWRFIPARRANEAACMWISTPMVFSLSDGAATPAANSEPVQR